MTVDFRNYSMMYTLLKSNMANATKIYLHLYEALNVMSGNIKDIIHLLNRIFVGKNVY